MKIIDRQSTLRILIIDDNINDIQLLQEEIRNAFPSSIFSKIESDSKFPEKFVQFRPDIIISAFNKPEIHYDKIIANLNEDSFNIPLLLLIQAEDESEALNCIENGAYDYIIKGNTNRLICTIINAARTKENRIELKHAELDIAGFEKYTQQYRRWEKNIPGMVYQFVLHPDGKYSFIYISDTSREMFGMEPEKVIGDINAVTALMPEDDLDKVKKALANSAQTLKTIQQEARFIINGRIRWYKFISKPELRPNGDITWDGFIINNTEQKHMENELAEEKAQIQTLIETLQRWDIDTGNLSGDHEKKNHYIAGLNNKGHIVDFNAPFLTDAVIDQNLFKTLMDNSPDAIYFKDLDSRFIRVNKSFIGKVGEFSEKKIIGKTDHDFFDLKHAQDARNDELKIIRTGLPLINKIEKESWPSGLHTWVSTTKMALRDKSENIIGTFGISRDVTETKLIEEAYEQERILLKEIIDAIPDRIYVKDSDGKFVINNIADMNALGIKSQIEIKDKTDYDFLPPKIAKQIFEEDKKVIITGSHILNKEEQLKITSGKLVWYLSTKVALTDMNGKIIGMVGLRHDITKKKEMDSALLASEYQLTNALKIALIAYWEYNLTEDFFTFNDQFYNLFRTTAAKEGGYRMSSKEYAGRFVYPEDVAIVSLAIQKTIKTKNKDYNTQLEHRIIYADGEIGYFSVRFFIIKDHIGRTVKSFGTIQDVTQRRRAEEALKASEYFLRKSQSVARLGSFNLDLKTGLWESSETIEEIFGIDKNFNKTFDGWLEIIHPDDRKEVNEYFNKHVLTEHQKFDKEYRIIRANDGKERWILSIGDLELDIDGKPAKLYGTAQDITERIIREKEKQELEKQLRLRNNELETTLHNLKQMQGSLVQSEKMASIGLLTAGIAHEINNPLAFVSSNINRLEEYFSDTTDLLKLWQKFGTKLKEEEKFKQRVNYIEKRTEEVDFDFIVEDFAAMMNSITEGIQRIKKIVEGLRGFAHISDSSFKEANIKNAIEDTLTIVWNELKYKATIKKEYGNLPEVICNIGEIKQVLVNLLVNAAHSIQEKGVITISTSAEGKWIFIKINDTGSGIPEENLKRIFDPFFTTKEIGKGTGLGLWVSSSIIEKHGGTITVKSAEGIGSTFTIKLPVEPILTKSKKEKTTI